MIDSDNSSYLKICVVIAVIDRCLLIAAIQMIITYEPTLPLGNVIPLLICKTYAPRLEIEEQHSFITRFLLYFQEDVDAASFQNSAQHQDEQKDSLRPSHSLLQTW